MGYEYHGKFEVGQKDKVEELLKSLPHFRNTEIFQNRKQFIYRTPPNSGKMPSGYAEIESDGIYFCDCGGCPSLAML